MNAKRFDACVVCIYCIICVLCVVRVGLRGTERKCAQGRRTVCEIGYCGEDVSVSGMEKRDVRAQSKDPQVREREKKGKKGNKGHDSRRAEKVPSAKGVIGCVGSVIG